LRRGFLHGAERNIGVRTEATVKATADRPRLQTAPPPGVRRLPRRKGTTVIDRRYRLSCTAARDSGGYQRKVWFDFGLRFGRGVTITGVAFFGVSYA